MAERKPRRRHETVEDIKNRKYECFMEGHEPLPWTSGQCADYAGKGSLRVHLFRCKRKPGHGMGRLFCAQHARKQALVDHCRKAAEDARANAERIADPRDRRGQHLDGVAIAMGGIGIRKQLSDVAELPRVRADLEHQMMHENEREVRGDLIKQLAARVNIEVPSTLLEREIDRRVEEFVRRLIEQQVDPMQTNINWEEFREKQREAAAEAVKSALMLDEVSRRENITASDAEVDEEVARYAERIHALAIRATAPDE